MHFGNPDTYQVFLIKDTIVNKDVATPLLTIEYIELVNVVLKQMVLLMETVRLINGSNVTTSNILVYF